jgi:valyl-tRNA synthetase
MTESSGPQTTETQHELGTRYDPSGIEAPLYARWVERGAFHVPADEVEHPYVMVIPPPNVTAALHMGHGLNNTIQDVVIRYQRMRGRDAVWVPGTDHAGIATQIVVERQLADE